MLTKLNTKELVGVLAMTPPEQNIMLVGKHGIGKSEILSNYFTAIGKKVVPVFCSQAADPGDIIGLPRENPETHQTEFSLPWWFPVDGQPIVLFLDELNRARPEILQVVMDLALNRKLAGKKLPEGSQIISAVNDGDEYQLTALDPALLSRFNIYEFEPTSKDWIAWAERHKLNGMVISFIKSNQKYLDHVFSESEDIMSKTPDRRAWNRVSDILNTNPSIDIILKKAICGIVGAEAGVRFYNFLETSAAVCPDALFTDFDKAAKTLKNAEIYTLTHLNESLVSNIDLMLQDDEPEHSEKECADVMKKYMKFLDSDNGNREAFANLISIYESGKYVEFNMFVVNNPSVEEDIVGFITRTATR